MISQILAGRGALDSTGSARRPAKFRRIANVAEHLACSLLSTVQPPRKRIGCDPLSSSVEQTARYRPVPIDRLKLAGNLAETILLRRSPGEPFRVDRNARLGLVIPYRDRPEQLQILLDRLEALLGGGKYDYRIVVAEQSDSGLFNRGKVKNVGADLLADWSDYFCFHDVDNIPQAADYGCPSQPMRLVKRYSHTHRRDNPIRGYFFGGVVSIRRDQFEIVNGYDNRYWGWGQEDEDLFLRCLLAGLIPHEDTQGLFSELDNPADEMTERTFLVRRRNRFLMKSGMLSRNLGNSGFRDLDYRVVSSKRSGRVLHARIDI